MINWRVITECIYYPVIFIFALNFLIGCQYASPRNPNHFVKGISVNPSILNPVLARDADAFYVCHHIYEALVTMDNETLAYKPLLATHWEVSKDHTVYTFHIKKDVYWHDGYPMTMADILFSYQVYMDKRLDNAHLRGYVSNITDLRALGSHMLQITVENPNFKTFEALSGIVHILPKHIFEDIETFNTNPYNRRPVGTGPYAFSHWKNNQRIVLNRFDHYHGQQPVFEKWIYKIIPNANTAFQMLKKESIDLADISTLQWVFQSDSDYFKERFSKYKFFSPNFTSFVWNLQKDIFKDKRVRQAMAMLIDRHTLLKNILFDLGETIESPIYKFSKNYNHDMASTDYHPEKAAALLRKAGWGDHNQDGILDKAGKDFEFTFIMPSGGSLFQSIMIYMQQQFLKVGIRMHVERLEWASYLRAVMSREFDAIIRMIVMPVLSDPYMLWHSSQAKHGHNVSGFSHPRVDALLEEARITFDANKRSVLYYEFAQILRDEMAAFFLFTLPTRYAYSKRFENVTRYPLGVDPYEWQIKPWHPMMEW